MRTRNAVVKQLFGNLASLMIVALVTVLGGCGGEIENASIGNLNDNEAMIESILVNDFPTIEDPRDQASEAISSNPVETSQPEWTGEAVELSSQTSVFDEDLPSISVSPVAHTGSVPVEISQPEGGGKNIEPAAATQALIEDPPDGASILAVSDVNTETSRSTEETHELIETSETVPSITLNLEGRVVIVDAEVTVENETLELPAEPMESVVEDDPIAPATRNVRPRIDSISLGCDLVLEAIVIKVGELTEFTLFVDDESPLTLSYSVTSDDVSIADVSVDSFGLFIVKGYVPGDTVLEILITDEYGLQDRLLLSVISQI